jgi:hypothetical protein
MSDQSPMDLAYGDDIDVTRPKVRQHGAEKFRRDLEMAIRLEFGVTAWADMVQHENGADTRENWSQEIMGPAEVKRFQSGADDVVAKLLH